MAPEEMRVEDVRFFVVGHAKSGTTWLERTLDSHPEVLCKSAGMFFGKGAKSVGGLRVLHEVLANCEGLRVWHEQGGGPNPWTKSHSFDEDVAQVTRAAIDALMRRDLTFSGKRALGDRSPYYFQHLDEISAFYPEARVIHAVRDGRDVMISAAHNRWRASRQPQSAIKLPVEETHKRDSYFEDRQSFISTGHSLFTEKRLRNQARSWCRDVATADQAGRRLFGDNYRKVRYEDHLAQPHETLDRLFRFLGVSTAPDVVGSVVEANSFEKVSGRARGEESPVAFLRKGVVGDWEEVFTERDKRIFKEEAGELLVRHGYEKDLNW